MFTFSVPAQWSERRLHFELDVVSDEINVQAMILCDRSLSLERQLMHAHIIAELRTKKWAIEERLRQLLVIQAA